MSRSKRDILETEAMLQRLEALLREQGGADPTAPGPYLCRADAETLRRISMTLHRWHELECGDSNNWQSWTISRGRKNKSEFEYDDNGAPYMEVHSHQIKSKPTYTRIPDRETAARKRLAAIMSRYPSLTAYVQSDPRGCALYILRPDDVPEGQDVSSYYSRGLAVHQ